MLGVSSILFRSCSKEGTDTLHNMGLIRIILKWLGIYKERNEGESSVSEADNESDNTNDVLQYKKLHQAARDGKWEDAEVIFSNDPDAVTAKITRDDSTALHIAVGAETNVFLEKLIAWMPKDALSITNGNNETALCYAAIIGNTEAAKMLVEKNEYLPYIWSGRNSPLHRAAQYGHREIVSFLLENTKPNIGRSPYADVRGVSLVELLIVSRFYDLALQVLKDHSNILEAIPLYKRHSPLMALARQPSSFFSGTSFNFYERCLYCILSPTPEIGNKNKENQNRRDVDRGKKNMSDDLKNQNRRDDNMVDQNQSDANTVDQNQSDDQMVDQTESGDNMVDQNQSDDVENQLVVVVHSKLSCCSQFWSGCRNAYEKLRSTFSEALHIKQVRDKKKMHQDGKDIVRYICEGVSGLGHEEAEQLFEDPFVLAATWGIQEIVNEIIREFPSAIWFTSDDGLSVFHLAVLNRRKRIFNLIERKRHVKQIIRKHIDGDQNNLLHLAARLAPSHRLSLISGALLQMQYELKWFKKVEEFVAVRYRESMNNVGKTPEMVFIEEHKILMKEAEDWMNKTAGACSTAATLIATVVFAAAITFPGGNDSDGLPILLHRRAFNFFAISDAIALFTSTASLLMFLSILTSRYSHKDFSKTLPRKLILGLLMLFISMASLMVAFSSALYLVIGHSRQSFLIGTVGVGGLVVLLFVFMFFSLIGKTIWSTYGREIKWLFELIW